MTDHELHAAAIFKDDNSILVAKSYIQYNKSLLVSLLDTGYKLAQAAGDENGSVQLDDYVCVYGIQDGHTCILLVSNTGVNMQEAGDMVQLILLTLQQTQEPFDLLNILDELSIYGTCNSFFLKEQNVKQRLQMHSEQELIYLQEKKIKEAEAEKIRKQREQELLKAAGQSTGIIGAGMRFLGFGRDAAVPKGHGVDEAVLQRLAMQQAMASQAPSSSRTEKREKRAEKQVEKDDSDSSDDDSDSSVQQKPQRKGKQQERPRRTIKLGQRRIHGK